MTPSGIRRMQKRNSNSRYVLVCAVAISALQFATTPAFAWDNKGHEIVGLIAEHYLKPAVRQKVDALLAGECSIGRRDNNVDFLDRNSDACIPIRLKLP